MRLFGNTVARAAGAVKAIAILAIACERGGDTSVVAPAANLEDVARAEPTKSPAEVWKDVGARREHAIRAHRGEAWSDAIAGWRSVRELVPDHAGTRYNLACALARSGDAASALGELEAVARMGIAMPVGEDPDLASLHGDPRWVRVVDAMAKAQVPGGAKHTREVVELAGFHAEGLAWDRRGERLLLGGIVGQSIAVVKGAEVETFATPSPVCSVLGVAVDMARERVVATCSAMPQGRTLPETPGWAAVLSYGLGGTPQLRLLLDDGGTHLLGDLAIADDGRVFATDTTGGGVVVTDGDALRFVVEPGTLPSPQGIVAIGDRLVVSDYAMGLVAIDGDRVTVLEPPPDTTLRGIDGLARHGDTIVAVQNGTTPARILRIDLDRAHEIERVTTVLVPDPADGEPTLASVDGDTLRIMQTDRWDRVFDAEGRPRKDVTIARPVILRMPWPQ